MGPPMLRTKNYLFRICPLVAQWNPGSSFCRQVFRGHWAGLTETAELDIWANQTILDLLGPAHF